MAAANQNKSTGTIRKKLLKKNKEDEDGDTVSKLYKCGKCEMQVGVDDKAVGCEICDLWFHINCEYIPDAVYKFMVEEEPGRQLHWTCSYCQRGCENLYKYIKKVEGLQMDLMSKQCGMEQTVANIGENIEAIKVDIECKATIGDVDQICQEVDIMNRKFSDFQKQNTEKWALFENESTRKLEEFKQEMKEVQRCVQNEVKEDFKDSYLDVVKKEVKMVCHERIEKNFSEDALVERTTKTMQSRLERKNNIILHGIPEEVKSGMNLGLRSEKIKQDKTIFMELCEEIEVECYIDDIVNIGRVGKYKSNVQQNKDEKSTGTVSPRPIKITLKEGIKERILRYAYRLKDTGKEMFKKARVTHDMTLEERTKDKELREEAKAKNEEESSLGNFYVVRGDPWERYLLKLRKRGVVSQAVGGGTM